MTREPNFQDLLREASNHRDLGVAMSFVQVEWGLDELRAHWDGYLDSAKSYGVTWPTVVECVQEFGIFLSEITSDEPVSY